MSINITAREFHAPLWNQMVMDAADTQRSGNANPQYIYKVIYPSETCCLELKTENQARKHLQNFGRLHGNCRKMPLREVVGITRICLPAGNDGAGSSCPRIKESLQIFSDRAEKKYQNGLSGLIRKLTAIFFNLFTSDSVALFRMPKTSVDIHFHNSEDRGKLPWFIGSDVDFIRFVTR